MTMPFVLTRSGGGITTAVRIPLFCEIFEVDRDLRDDNRPDIHMLKDKPDLLHDMGADIPVVQDGDLVLLNLNDLFLRQSEVGSENVTRDGRICRNPAPCVEDKRSHGELLPPLSGDRR